MRLRSVLFFGFVVVMMGLGLLVNSIFFLVGMVSLCGGHMLLGHGEGHDHKPVPATAGNEEKKSTCH